MKLKKTTLLIFILPAVLMFSVIFVYPIIRTLLMSFFKIESITDSFHSWTFVGIENYQKLMSTSLFMTSLWNLFRIWSLGGIIVMSLALLFAVVLTSGIKGKKFFRAVIYLPNIVSAVALATIWLQYVYNPKFGLFATFFKAIGLESLAKIQWTAPHMKFWGLLIAYCFGMVGYHMLIFLSGIERIDKSYYEAATIDGARKPQQFLYITLPLIKDVFKTNITIWSVSSVAFFVWSQLFSTVTNDLQTITPMVYMYTQVFGGANTITERNAGLGATVGVVLSAFVVAIFWIVNATIREEKIEM